MLGDELEEFRVGLAHLLDHRLEELGIRPDQLAHCRELRLLAEEGQRVLTAPAAPTTGRRGRRGRRRCGLLRSRRRSARGTALAWRR